MSDIGAAYRSRYDAVLTRLAARIEDQLQDYLSAEPRIDRIQTRAKAVDRFIAKALKQERGKPKYDEPLHQIQDQVGARIVTFYLSDVDRLSDLVTKYYRPVETKFHIPESEWEFGYFGQHFVLLVPTELIDSEWDRASVPQFFELQIKTLFQHAWSEANHDLGYKAGGERLGAHATRQIAFASAQAWGADQIFEELSSGPLISGRPSAPLRA